MPGKVMYGQKSPFFFQSEREKERAMQRKKETDAKFQLPGEFTLEFTIS